MRRILITTPIYYVNDKPHIGHAYTTLAADVLTRFFKSQGKEVFFLTGTDEHGDKIAKTAENLGKTPKEFCDENSEFFKKTWKNLDIKYDYFVRTTDKRHEEAVRKFVTKLRDEDTIYEKEYEGLYCIACEKFLTEKDLIDGFCPDHKTKPEKVSETNYFFRLRNYIEKVGDLIKKDKIKIEPEYIKKEVLGLLNQGLYDFSISRQKVKWGIPIPFNTEQTIYVWVDALLNYITAIGYGDNDDQFKKWWQDGYVIHLLAKDILKFHVIYWPALLLAVGEKVPDQEFIHGFFTVNGQKMSKTLGNIIDPNNLLKNFGVDATRYLLLSQFPSSSDGDIQESRFKEKYNADLANGLGNFAARVSALRFQLPEIGVSKVDKDIYGKIKEAKKIADQKLEEFKFNEALNVIWDLIAFGDKYINQTQVWKIKDLKTKKQIIFNLISILNSVAVILEPFLPETSAKISRLKKGEILFPRR